MFISPFQFHVSSLYSWDSSILLTGPFSSTQTLKSKTQLTIAFFSDINDKYVDNQRTLKKQKQRKWIEIYQSHSRDVNYF